MVLELPDEFFELLAVLLEFPDELAELFDELLLLPPVLLLPDDVLLLPDDELLLLRAEGEPAARAVLAQLDAIEAQGIAPADVSPAYWRTLGNRLAAHLPLPAYTAKRHAAWLAGRGLS